MTKDEFLDTIAERAHVDRDEAERIARNVIVELRSRLSPAEIHDIFEHIPEDLEGLWSGGWLQRLVARLQSFREMDESEFLEQVRQAVDVRTIDEAKRLTEIVFNALKAAIPQEEIAHIARELPSDIREFWQAA